jgi:hypothetical protein
MEYERDEFLSILTDLIAELRPYLRYDFVDTQVLNIALERAEARLNELDNE